MRDEIKKLHEAILLEKDIKKQNFLRLKLQIAIDQFNQQRLVSDMLSITNAKTV